jgi:hypothetical protein
MIFPLVDAITAGEPGRMFGQRTNSAIKMTMGIGTPSNKSRMDRIGFPSEFVAHCGNERNVRARSRNDEDLRKG